MRWQHAHPTDHCGQVDEQQWLIAEDQQPFGNRLITELQQRFKLGLGEVLQQLFAVGPDIRQPLVELRNTVPQTVKHVAKPLRVRQLQRGVAIDKASLGIALPYRPERARPLATQAAFQRADLGLIGGIQRLDVVPGNVGVKADPVLPVDGALGDFENAAGADGFVDGVAEGATVLRDFLQHHRRITDGHEPRALEHMHQLQRRVGFAGRDGAAGIKRPGDGRNQRNFIPHLEHLLDIQRREAPEALGPGVVGVQAVCEVVENPIDVACLRVHRRHDQKAYGGNQEAAPSGWVLIENDIGVPSHCVIRRGTLQRFSRRGSRGYLAVR